MNVLAERSGRRVSVRAPEGPREPLQTKGPIVAAVDASPASRPVIDAAVRLAAELAAPLLFVFVRRGPAGFFGSPVYQRRLTKALAGASRVLDRALRAAAHAGVDAEGEILEGSPRRRILEFARAREASLIIIGSRRRKLGRSVSRAVARGADGPVMVARRNKPALREQTV